MRRIACLILIALMSLAVFAAPAEARAKTITRTTMPRCVRAQPVGFSFQTAAAGGPAR